MSFRFYYVLFSDSSSHSLHRRCGKEGERKDGGQRANLGDAAAMFTRKLSNNEADYSLGEIREFNQGRGGMGAEGAKGIP